MVTINIIGYKQLQDTLKKLPDNFKKEVGTVLRAGADQFRAQAIKDAPADVYTLRGQITVNPVDDFKYEVISGATYSAYMEFGTKRRFKPIPGIDASEFKGSGGGSGKGFYDNILAWVRRKGFAALTTKSGRKSKSLDSTIAEEQAAFRIYLSILRHGVKPHPFFFKQIPIVRRDLIRNLRNTLNRLLG